MNHKTTIGKFALDSLTIGMYENEMVIYREYIQNSTDAIDKAIKLGWLKSNEDANIKVNVCPNDRTIEIEDNGVGIEKNKAYSKLADIGNSDKDYLSDRGFRGIGRLAGTAYCDKIVFETSTKGESEKSIITWNCKKLKKLLQPGEYRDYDLEKVINECVSVEYDYEENNKHFFKVIMHKVEEKSDLLNVSRVKEYLSQVAPLEMDVTCFYYYADLNSGIKRFMKDNDIPIEEYPVEVNGERMTKLYSTVIKNNDGKKVDDIVGINCNIITNDSCQPIAFLWYGDRKNCNSQIADSRVAGIRYRKDNIMVGNEETLSKFFTESRFNKYYIGELYILDKKIIPNARRDDFEDNDNYKILKDKFTEIAKRLTSIARNFSDMNNSYKKVEEAIKENEQIIERIETEKLNKETKEELENKIKDNNSKIAKNSKKYGNSVSKLRDLGRKDIDKTISYGMKNDTFVSNNDSYLHKDNNEDYKNNKKKYDPLRGVSRDIVKVTRGILDILKNELKNTEYENIEAKVYDFVRKGKR